MESAFVHNPWWDCLFHDAFDGGYAFNGYSFITAMIQNIIYFLHRHVCHFGDFVKRETLQG
jgi:hypothetical protein